MLNQLQAVAIATRFLVTHEPDAAFNEVWARMAEGVWWISFGQVFSPGLADSSGYCVTVDLKTGKAKWFLTL